MTPVAACWCLCPFVEQAVLGGPADAGSDAYAHALRQAGEQRDWGSLAAHLAASGLLAPAWEEVSSCQSRTTCVSRRSCMLHATGPRGAWPPSAWPPATCPSDAQCCVPRLAWQVFWRAFFLTSLTKVLPLPACVAASAANFAALHLSPGNALPLALLGGAADWLYLRSGGNLLAPLLLHVAWNSGQVLAVALLGKESFV